MMNAKQSKEKNGIVPAPKARDFYKTASDTEGTIRFMMDRGLLKNQMDCSICKSEMRIASRRDISDLMQWRCVECLSTSSIRMNSPFKNSKLPITKLLELIYYFGLDMQVYEVEKLTDISHCSVIQWFDEFRKICAESLQKDPIVLGSSESSIIEIDESLYGKKRKYNRGTGRQDTWVFGMVEKGSRKVIFKVVERRNRDTLIPLVKENVTPGTTVYSDSWAAYNTLVNEGYVHKTVNHSKEFKSIDGVCTNEIEGIWGITKNKIKKMKGILHDRIQDILNEYSYRYRYGLSNGDVFSKLIIDMANGVKND